MTKLPLIRVGDRTFLGDGAAAFGAVREVAPGGTPTLIIHIEGFGDTTVSLETVDKVVEGRVVLRYEALESDVQRAIRHTQDREDFPPRDEGEVTLVPGADELEDEDEDGRAQFAEPPASALDELPGRAEGARYGTPPSLHPKAMPVKSRSDGR